MTCREGYRLTLATRNAAGGFTYSPLAGDDRIFATWREAHDACQVYRAAGRNAAMQAVQLDEDGAVVWPPPGQYAVSRGRWTVAPIVRVARRVSMPDHKRPGERQRRPVGTVPRRRRCNLDPRVVARIAEIRETNPGFGRGR